MDKRELPEIIRRVGFDFPFDFERDPSKVWGLDLPIDNVPITQLLWHLDIPFWSSDNGFYDMSPNSLLEDPHQSPSHYCRVLKAELEFPIDIVPGYKGHDKVIDGLHRLTRMKMLGYQEVPVRMVSLELLLKTINK